MLTTHPFVHRVIDDWGPPELVRAVDMEWPDTNWPYWHHYECGKLATKDPLRFPPACAEAVRRMLSAPVGGWMDMTDLFGDWNCHGGGMHSSPPGTQLGKHLDSDHHPQTGWRRACNAILFVNPVWKSPAWGGELELWNADGSVCVTRIEPKFNRLVLFEPSSVAYHSVARNAGPETRKTLATFFWQQADAGAAGSRSRAQFVT